MEQLLEKFAQIEGRTDKMRDDAGRETRDAPDGRKRAEYGAAEGGEGGEDKRHP